MAGPLIFLELALLAAFLPLMSSGTSCKSLDPGIVEWDFAVAGQIGGEEREATMILVKNGLVYTPEPIGKAHILLGGGSVLAVFSEQQFPWINLTGIPLLEVIDVEGDIVVPGLIDMHVHITGGGGEMGPSSRTPEAGLAEILEAGITTLVGVLGTDCVSRSLENLRTKAKALQEEGITAYMWSGCYRVPSPTLTGNLVRDLQLINEVIGAGEIAISDHRGSWPSTEELLHLVSDARVGGMLSGKAGIVHFHVGSASSLLDPLWSVFNASREAIPLTQMIPTHVSHRGPELVKAAEVWVKAGGLVDFTSDQEGETASYDALKDWADRDVPTTAVSISSDAFGSLPVFDSKGNLVKYAVASPLANLNTIRRLIREAEWKVENAISLSTKNPAKFLSLSHKGHLSPGSDGDVLVLDQSSLDVKYVIAKGRLLRTPSWTKKGLFEH
ncbi:uncharacterized protein LOC9634176 [Selaginella moellendorffii]|nr:uncharacterized protein LOC9634176 [Selaginella moellendorffii]|eukprot:XP_002981941.2 uncharacterized protein LOC9634176 [Selaginella moellendorffii]